ncbi:hypothetical protein EUX98_g1601 [Antrodiella citrinella]|uniref:Uncharacterized protein n=1 Tax=Antrodiella citrinella TaxID=2447956 RepID=A0A4S4N3E2_9APHY|nr:hypothetical protein EUX98_g1601 [Antrodiella citrinella]
MSLRVPLRDPARYPPPLPPQPRPPLHRMQRPLPPRLDLPAQRALGPAQGVVEHDRADFPVRVRRVEVEERGDVQEEEGHGGRARVQYRALRERRLGDEHADHLCLHVPLSLPLVFSPFQPSSPRSLPLLLLLLLWWWWW